MFAILYASCVLNKYVLNPCHVIIIHYRRLRMNACFEQESIDKKRRRVCLKCEGMQGHAMYFMLMMLSNDANDCSL